MSGRHMQCVRPIAGDGPARMRSFRRTFGVDALVQRDDPAFAGVPAALKPQVICAKGNGLDVGRLGVPRIIPRAQNFADLSNAGHGVDVRVRPRVALLEALFPSRAFARARPLFAVRRQVSGQEQPVRRRVRKPTERASGGYATRRGAHHLMRIAMLSASSPFLSSHSSSTRQDSFPRFGSEMGCSDASGAT